MCELNKPLPLKFRISTCGSMGPQWELVMLQNRAFNGLIPCFCSQAGQCFCSASYQHIYQSGWSLVTDGCKWLYWGLSITPESHLNFTLNANDMQISPVLIICHVWPCFQCAFRFFWCHTIWTAFVVEDISWRVSLDKTEMSYLKLFYSAEICWKMSVISRWEYSFSGCFSVRLYCSVFVGDKH